MRTPNRAALVVASAIAGAVIAGRYAARFENWEDVTTALYLALVVNLLLGGVGGYVLSGSTAAAPPAAGTPQVLTAFWRRVRRAWWGLLFAWCAMGVTVFATLGGWYAVAGAAGLIVAAGVVVLASRLHGRAAVVALVATTATAYAVTVNGQTDALIALDEARMETGARAQVAEMAIHLEAAREYLADGNRLYAFEEHPINPLRAVHLGGGKPERFVQMNSLGSGEFVFISNAPAFESDLLDGCSPVKAPTRGLLPAAGETQCWTIPAHDAVARLTGTSSPDTVRVVIEFVKDGHPVRILAQRQYPSPSYAPYDLDRILGDVIEYDPDRWSVEDMVSSLTIPSGYGYGREG